jgi:hypothetical protein
MYVRKIAVYCIALLIILASTGLKLNAHYCHGTFAGFELVLVLSSFILLVAVIRQKQIRIAVKIN